jgi:ribose 5-phosphate isomerase B
MNVYFATDHAGFDLKNKLVAYAKEIGYTPVDCGAHIFDKDDDYPPIIASAASKLSLDIEKGIESRAVVIGASGQGEAMVANRFKGVRCALYYGRAKNEQEDMSGKHLSILAGVREHNNANCLSLAARFLSEEEAKAALKEWLETPFPREARHARRIKKIDEVN